MCAVATKGPRCLSLAPLATRVLQVDHFERALASLQHSTRLKELDASEQAPVTIHSK